MLYHLMPISVTDKGATWHPAECGARGLGTVVGGKPLTKSQGVFFREQAGVYSGPFLRIP